MCSGRIARFKTRLKGIGRRKRVAQQGDELQILSNIRQAWRTIRWKMLIIFVFFSVISTFLVACFSVAVLNVVIRRESTYLVEERINGILDRCRRFTPSLIERVQGCHTPPANSPLLTEYPTVVWPGGQSF